MRTSTKERHWIHYGQEMCETCSHFGSLSVPAPGGYQVFRPMPLKVRKSWIFWAPGLARLHHRTFPTSCGIFLNVGTLTAGTSDQVGKSPMFKSDCGHRNRNHLHGTGPFSACHPRFGRPVLDSGRIHQHGADPSADEPNSCNMVPI